MKINVKRDRGVRRYEAVLEPTAEEMMELQAEQEAKYGEIRNQYE